MKRIMLVILSIFILFGCEEKLDTEKILEDVKKEMSDLTSLKVNADLDVSLSGSEEGLLNIPVKMVIIQEGLNTNRLKSYLETSVSFLGQEAIMKEWTVDGTVYKEEDGVKTYSYEDTAENLDSAAFFASFFELKEADSFEARKDGEDIVLSTVIENDDLNSLMSAIFNSAEFSFANPIAIDIIISEDDLIKGMNFDFEMNFEGMGTFTIGAEMSLSEYDEAYIPYFDPVEFSDEGSYEAGYVYGDYDITYDQIAELESLGYIDYGDDVYSNGTDYIDLELKQFYSSFYMVYDWEYDQVYEYTQDHSLVCTYDFDTGIVEGDEDVCNIEEYQQLKDAYNDLAKEILE